MKQRFNRYTWYKIIRGVFKGKYFLFDNLTHRGVQFYRHMRKWAIGALGWQWTYNEIVLPISNVKRVLRVEVPSAILRLRKGLMVKPT